MTAHLVPRAPQTVAESAKKSVLPSLERWLEKLQGSDQIPARTAALLPQARAEVRQMLEPPSTEQIAVEVARLLEWGRGMGMAGKGLEAVADAYLEDLKTIPADLLATAISRARTAHRYGNRLPLAAEIRSQVQEEMDQRYRLKMQLEKAAKCKVEPADPTPYRDMTPEQKADVDQMLANLKKQFAW